MKLKPADPSLVMSDPSWVHLVNQPMGPALARAEFDRLGAAILDTASIQRFVAEGEPASNQADAFVEAAEPPD